MTALSPGPLRVFSYGGGWQSAAALVLAARGALDFRTAAAPVLWACPACHPGEAS